MRYVILLMLFLMVCLVASYGYAGIRHQSPCANGQCTVEVPVIAAVVEVAKKPLEVASAVKDRAVDQSASEESASNNERGGRLKALVEKIKAVFHRRR